MTRGKIVWLWSLALLVHQGVSFADRLPLLDYRKIPVSYELRADASETGVQKLQFTFADPGSRNNPMHAVFHLYFGAGAAAASRPLILVFPMSEDVDYRISKSVCSHLLDNGFRCVYMERSWPGANELPSGMKQLFSLPGLPPHSTLAARRGLDALAEAGALRIGEKIGTVGVSLGAIDAELLALTDERVQAAAFILGGANLPYILSHLGGRGVEDYRAIRDSEMKANGWTLRDFEREMVGETRAAEPLAYLDAEKNPKLPADRFLMINVKEDQTIPNKASDDLYAALSRLPAGRQGSSVHPDYEVLYCRFPAMLLPSSWMHLSALLRIDYIERRITDHFKKFLPAP